MTKNEALKATIDGKKIRLSTWKDYIYFDGDRFAMSNGCKNLDVSLCPVTGWEIVPEYVGFATAWNAYENGKKIQSEFWGAAEIIAKRGEPEKGFRWCFTPSEIRGKWAILEGE